MAINRRRAPSSEISSEKKKSGHKNEEFFAALIDGQIIKGIKKKDVKDKSGKFHSVKSGKKWQIFLYTFNRISDSLNLNILKPCLEAFPEDYDSYLKDRVLCISFKEEYLRNHGRDRAKLLSNETVIASIDDNIYINSKFTLKQKTESICNILKDKNILKKIYEEAIFNNSEVNFLTIKDEKNEMFKIFSKNDVLNIFVDNTYPSISNAGKVPIDFNVAGQKILLRYQITDIKLKTLVEIEVRNESKKKYRLLRFNMYSKDALYLLNKLTKKTIELKNKKIQIFGQAIEEFTTDL